MEIIPSHRQLITTLIQSLSNIQPPTLSSPSSAATSPLHAISQNHRHLLLTLHVLFPNHLLPALDLLDRGLVTRLNLADLAGESDPPPSSSQDGDSDDSMTGDGSSDTPNDSPGGLSGTFVVKSLGTTLLRRNRDVGLSSKRYPVHLETWNCSCASFTFEAFPVDAGSPLEYEHGGAPDNAPENQPGWSFGGMSLDGLGAGGNVPCCKHLLACLLVDKWPGMLKKYAEERTVSREEMAGLIADM
ncbi:Fc.00g030070.m01.CDS01 [Cosmosporella sp. VM-42]